MKPARTLAERLFRVRGTAEHDCDKRSPRSPVEAKRIGEMPLTGPVPVRGRP